MLVNEPETYVLATVWEGEGDWEKRRTEITELLRQVMAQAEGEHWEVRIIRTQAEGAPTTYRYVTRSRRMRELFGALEHEGRGSHGARTP